MTSMGNLTLVAVADDVQDYLVTNITFSSAFNFTLCGILAAEILATKTAARIATFTAEPMSQIWAK